MRAWRKRVFMVCLILFFAAGSILAFAGSAWAKEDGAFEIQEDTLLRYTGGGGAVVIPEGIAVIGEEAFLDCATVTDVEIPASVKEIKKRAFFGCTGLGSVRIPGSVKELGDGAFSGCTGLTEVILEEGIETIGGFTGDGYELYKWDGVFSGCTALQRAELPDSVRLAGVKTFLGCTGLQQVKLSDKMDSICRKTFEGCTGLTQITIPESVACVYQDAFCDCGALEEINFPKRLKCVGADAFAGTKWMADRLSENPLVIAGRVLINGRAASGRVRIPEHVVQIAERAFYGNQKLTEVEIPGSVESIGAASFESCKSLKRVTLAAGLKDIAPYAFDKCESLTDIKIPEGVGTLGDGAFARCGRLKRAEIPASVDFIGENAFLEAGELTVWGLEKSFAQSYAAKKHIPFRNLGSDRGTLRFDANGGRKPSFGSMEVVENSTYGKLPDTARKGYLFGGWYTAAKGGVRVTEASIVKFPWEPVLYAHWSNISVKKASQGKLVNLTGGKLKIKWKKVPGADGYEIRYAANKKVRKPKRKTTGSKTLTVKKLKKGKTYYVKIRAYRTDSAGKKVYGAYSKTRKVKIEK